MILKYTCLVSKQNCVVSMQSEINSILMSGWFGYNGSTSAWSAVRSWVLSELEDHGYSLC